MSKQQDAVIPMGSVALHLPSGDMVHAIRLPDGKIELAFSTETGGGLHRETEHMGRVTYAGVLLPPDHLDTLVRLLTALDMRGHNQGQMEFHEVGKSEPVPVERLKQDSIKEFKPLSG